PETHLIPLALDAALGKHPSLTVFGDDYDTRDGTCIRDYIHVTDLAVAHLLALRTIGRNGCFKAYNLGSGNGFSVSEVIACAEHVTGRKVPVVVGDRRIGDPPILVAGSSKARAELGWEPKFSDLNNIVRTAYLWAKTSIE
ncbi:MAG: GDP-mannose 4,6-dehydratase, partial [Candidatus Poribacteria bacterium]